MNISGHVLVDMEHLVVGQGNARMPELFLRVPGGPDYKRKEVRGIALWVQVVLGSIALGGGDYGASPYPGK